MFRFADLSSLLFVMLAMLSFTGCASTEQQGHHRADIVIYGDASGGVIAAVTARQLGKDVVLVSQYAHLGGLTSSGLGWTDLGNPKILGGLSRAFYHRLYEHYQSDEAWVYQERANYPNKGQGTAAFDDQTQLASVFEPKVAEQVFDEMAKEAGVKIVYGRLDLYNGVVKRGKRITAIRLEDGTVIAGDMFIDASYEGDLMPGAGVSYVMGRESNDEFDEQGNGNTGVAKKNQLRNGIDPYVVKGDPSSGLLPYVNPDLGGDPGDGDHRFQAYCYRMCLTDVPENRITIEKPEGYDERDYEILFRSIEAGQKGGFFKTSPMPNRKTDSNNVGGVSTDFIGANYGDNWNWATLKHREREVLADMHKQWQLGLVWTLQNHSRVPKEIRKAYGMWGLPKDEFADNGHWPYNLYVREARRMRSDFVMTENHCKRKLSVEDPIGMGAYTLDSHNTQRVVHNGMVKNEGDIQTYLRGKAYGIAYRSIVPKQDECENLLVPWALSATHIAFGSIRMEPVFMILSESAVVAACIAIDRDLPVQAVDYDDLKPQLEARGQVLRFDD
ncbi:MAG: FAD-dependent oxidoreductase [Phycisphaeraceae bacterium]